VLAEAAEVIVGGTAHAGEEDVPFAPSGDGDTAVTPGRASWWRRPVPAVAVLAAVVVAAVVVTALAVNLASTTSDLDALTEQLADTEAALDGARQDRDDLEGDLEALRKDLEEERERADTAEERAVETAAAELADERAALDARAAELDAKEADVVTREQQLDALVNGLRASEFGDGVHQVGRDIQPGRYHTEGSGRTCYYALLGPDGRDILDNNLVEGPATVVIDSPYFESSRCGTWTKVG